MLIGVVGVGLYIGSALILMPRLQILGLALSNTIQNSLHALILLALMFATIGTLAGRGILKSVGKALLAGLAMGIGAWISAILLGRTTSSHLFVAHAIEALVPLCMGAALYVGVAALLRSEELGIVWSIARRR
jgi:putative peptidoglycan lipid II flippase